MDKQPLAVPSAEFTQIVQTLGRYAWANDSRNFEAVKYCFTEEATYTTEWTPGETSTTIGRDRIFENFSSERRYWPATQRRKTTRRRHMVTNVDVMEYRDPVAHVRSCFTVVSTPQEGETWVELSGWYEDTMEKQSDGRWLISSRITRSLTQRLG